MIRSGPRVVSGDAISFLKADGIQLFGKIITNGMTEVSANHHVHGKITRGSEVLLRSGWLELWEEVGIKERKMLLVP